MEISASQVMELRKITSLSMMECKKALTESAGDFDKAIALLRERGLKKVAERSGNQTPNGRIFIAKNGARTAMVGIGCETEPVTATDDFKMLGDAASKIAAGMATPTPDAIKDSVAPGGSRKFGELLDDVLNRIREKIVITQAGACEGNVASYIHHNGMVGVLVEFNQACPPALGNDVCMHIAAMQPRCLKREEADPADVARERENFMKEVQGKPANIMEQIVNGKMSRWYSEFVLLDQPFVKDDKKSVQQTLTDAVKGLTINRYLRFKIGV
ncbi:MAG: translation elongation factor Ts [Phycisphaerae bacterium]|nr:translation elongation factor Ts [Phycisphaerae bacterium]